MPNDAEQIWSFPYWSKEYFDVFSLFGGIEVLDKEGEDIEPRAEV